MAASDYVFQTHWRIDGTREQVYEIIENTPDYVRWWPSVWLRIDPIDPGDELGIGKSYRLLTKGWLPYLLRWQSRTIEKVFPERLALTATGDFQGEGVWTFQQHGSTVDIVYDWRIRADKPLLRRLSFLMRPLFSWNHNWAMNKGLQSLKLELARRHAPTDEDRAKVPAPPKAVFWFGKPKSL